MRVVCNDNDANNQHRRHQNHHTRKTSMFLLLWFDYRQPHHCSHIPMMQVGRPVTSSELALHMSFNLIFLSISSKKKYSRSISYQHAYYYGAVDKPEGTWSQHISVNDYDHLQSSSLKMSITIIRFTCMLYITCISLKPLDVGQSYFILDAPPVLTFPLLA